MKHFLVLLLAFGLASCRPQDTTVGLGDIEDAAEDAERYGQDAGQVDPSVLNDAFGINSNDFRAPNATVDTTSSRCEDYAEHGYKCVPFKQCDEFGEIITGGGPDLFNVRFGSIELDAENSKCEGFLEVCCRHPDFTHLVTRPPTTTTTTTAAPIISTTPTPYQSKCGRRNANGVGVRVHNIAGGDSSTQFGEFPHMCAITQSKPGRNNAKKNFYVCGGSLIAPGIVMTAAHCVDKIDSSALKVRCGEWDTRKRVEPAPHQDRLVEYVSVHPGYNPRNLTHDIALLHTVEDFVLDRHVDVVCLPNLRDGEHSYNWEQCLATGWGKDQFNGGSYQLILRKVQLDLVDRDTCQNSLRSTRLGAHFRLDETAMCAGGLAGVDTCKGDGGGPLVCPSPSRTYIDNFGQETPAYVQAGMVGWGIGCGEDGIPGVYTHVAKELCFIDWATKCHNGESSDLYGITCGKDWAAQERRSVRRALRSYESQADTLPDSRTRRRILRRVNQHREAEARWTEAINACKEKQQDFVDYDDCLDISDFGRRQECIGRARAGDFDDEEEYTDVSRNISGGRANLRQDSPAGKEEEEEDAKERR